MTQQPLFAEVSIDPEPRTIPEAQPNADTVYLVATWYAPDNRWKIWKEQWTTNEKAVSVGESYLRTVRGHTHFVILTIELPGVKP